jgi:chromosome partitioning protein
MAHEQAGPPVVAVFNHKGGVAKTTTACNVAVCLAACGHRTLLVDLDAQGNATASFGLLPLPNVGTLDVLAGRSGIAEVALPTPFPGLTLLPATTALRMAELELGGDEQAMRHLRDQLAGSGGATADIDVVVIDCPPSFGMVTLNALLASSAVLIPTRPDPFAHEGLANTWYEIKRLCQEANADLAVAGILLTMTEAAGAVADGALSIRAEFGEQVYVSEIATDAKVGEAAQLSLPVTVLDPDGLAGRAYVEATAELLRRLGRWNGTAEPLPEGWTGDTLNTLREWRSGQLALNRIPKGERGWVAARRAIGPEPPPRHSPLLAEVAEVTGRVDRHWLAASFAAGALAGAAAALAALWLRNGL